MNAIPDILQSFESITLEEMDAVKLLDRMDMKYIFHRNRLEDILACSQDHFRVLQVEGRKCSRYETHYYDTPDYRMYTQHHNGKLNRHKIRFRKYVDSGLAYFEIKYKNNKGRTIKDRVKVREPQFIIKGESEFLLEKKTIYHADMLQEAIRIQYNRITLVNKNLNERVTIDLDLTYTFNDQIRKFPSLVIAEVKQDKTQRSPFTSVMQSKYIIPMSLSKYCFGIASMNPAVKINNFKPKLLNVKKLCNGDPE